MGRPRDKEVRKHFTDLGRGRVKCNECGHSFSTGGGSSRMKAHINKLKDKGVRPCSVIPQSNNEADDAKYQQRIQVASSSVSNRDNEDSQVLQYVSKHLSPGDRVFESPCSHLTQQEFITLIKPETYLNSLVIDSFADILTDMERKKKNMPSINWYLPVIFSNTAVKGSVGDFLYFVHRQKISEHYTSGDLNSCEKMFIPVHIGETHGGHFYLYIIHLMNKEIEIWDPLPKTTVAQRDETTKKLLHAMEVLFWTKFTQFEVKIANNDIFFQDNRFDCGIFVINYMQQSNNYVKRDDSIFQFDSTKEREDLALKLLKSDLNQVKQDIYEKARQHYAAQVEKQGLGKLIEAFFGDISTFNNTVRSLEDNCVLRSFDFILRDDDIVINRGDSVKKRITLAYMNLENRKIVLPGDTKELIIYECRQGRSDRYMCGVLSYAHNNYLRNNTHQIEVIYSSFHDAEYLCCLSGSCSFCCSSQLVGSITLHVLKELKHLVPPSDALPSLDQSSLFSHLTELSIWGCDSMESVMTPQLLAVLQNLRSIDIGHCDKMKAIVTKNHSEMQLAPSGELIAVVHNDLSHRTLILPNLTSLKLKFMPELNFIYRGIMLCPSLQRFSVYFCYSQLNLPQIEISNGCAIQIEKAPHGYHWQRKIID